MMPPRPTVERAYQLAESGQCTNFDELRSRLKAEQCEAVDGHLCFRSLRADLQALFDAAQRRHAKGALRSPSPNCSV